MSSARVTSKPAHRQVSVCDRLGPNGLLTQHLPGYEARPGQLKLAVRIEAAIDDEAHLIAEGATGVGKGLAYLIPSVLRGHHITVATATTLLQDQLALKEVPRLQRVLPDPFTFAVIKGHSRDVCELEFQRFALDVQQQMALLQSAEHVAIVDLVERWVQDERAHAGVAALDASGLAIPAEITQHITTDARHCLGRDCPLVKQCFAERATARAQEADVVIANHHLVRLDAALREHSDGGVTLLPERDVLILDEAHHLEETATSGFGVDITVARWRWLPSQFARLRHARAHTVEALFAMADEGQPVALDTLLDQVYQALHEAATQADALFAHWLDRIGEPRSMPIPEAAAG
ncbi:MAG: hypothetical protein M3361_13525 [Candidatus Tectomicrobia bacterium]|nr:hypothetical protein [Candidatus Tectomicrobia bacterium]